MMMMMVSLLTVAVGPPVVAEDALGELSVVAIEDTTVEFLGVVALTTAVIIVVVTEGGEIEEEQLEVFEGLGDTLGLAPYERVAVGLIIDDILGFVDAADDDVELF